MEIDASLFTLACNPTRANPHPVATAVIKQSPEDFVVDEIPITTPAGTGEHVWLQIRKRNTNTDWLAGQIARFAEVDRRQVSYAGRKDRQAVTTQWFSVHMPGKTEPDWQALNNDEMTLLQASRHTRKLRRGALLGNRFVLRLHDLHGDLSALQDCLVNIGKQGVPNYFGEQRFGRNGENIALAGQMLFQGTKFNRNQKNILLSAARSLLFNAVLDARVRDNSWLSIQTGDVLQKDGRHGFFTVDKVDKALQDRLLKGEVHITGPLWGRGRSLVSASAQRVEQTILAPFDSWCRALEDRGLTKDIRALRANVSDLSWHIEQRTLEIAFSLVAGCYATSVLRECLDCTVAPTAGSQAF